MKPILKVIQSKRNAIHDIFSGYNHLGIRKLLKSMGVPSECIIVCIGVSSMHGGGISGAYPNSQYDYRESLNMKYCINSADEGWVR